MILFVRWNAATESDIKDSFNFLSALYEELDFPTRKKFLPPKTDAEFLETLGQKLKTGKYHAVFTVNAFSEIATLCHSLGICYIFWSYDSPIEYGEYLKMNTTKLFIFDRDECRRIKKAIPGCSVHHLPLAVNTRRLDAFRNKPVTGNRSYVSAASFVGALYGSLFSNLLKEVGLYYEGYLKAVMDSQMKIYGEEITKKTITENLIKDISPAIIPRLKEEGYIRDEKEPTVPGSLLWHLLMEEITHRERVTLLELLSRHMDTALYSRDVHEALKGTRMMGFVDYLFEMPNVFINSGINLNITFRGIVSGIPQRCLDIMGCGGFLLSNYQSELDEYFIDGEECVLYSDMEDALEKALYYNSHEDERRNIAARGYNKVKKVFGYEDRIGRILSEVRK